MTRYFKSKVNGTHTVQVDGHIYRFPRGESVTPVEDEEHAEAFASDEYPRIEEGEPAGEPEPETKGTEDEDDSEEETSEEEEQTAVEFLEEASNSDVEEHVKDIEDVEVLEGLLEAEENNRNRKGATEAIEERIGELTSDSDDE